MSGVTGELALDTDPRLGDGAIRVIDGGPDEGAVVLVGVVHDHPASIYRVRQVIERVDPAVLALELPSFVVRLFERYAAEDGERWPGGEMAAAMDAAETDDVVGIDMPSRAFLRKLTGTLRRAAPPPRVVGRVLASVATVTRHTLRCRIGGVLGRPSLAGELVEAYDHDCDPADPPAVQADHEATQLTRSRALLRAAEPPSSRRITDEAREAAMAEKLAALREDGTVVAVVGFDHLESVVAFLAGRAQ